MNVLKIGGRRLKIKSRKYEGTYPKLKEQIILRFNPPDPTILYDKYSDESYVILNSIILKLLRLCDGTKTLYEICSLFQKERKFGLKELYKLLRELSMQGIIEFVSS